jgi:hypothetical protein
VIEPPGNSLELDQDERVADPGEDLASGMQALLARIGEELDFSDAKGTAPYRLGMHDGLRFAEEAVADLLRRHGHEAATTERAVDT